MPLSQFKTVIQSCSNSVQVPLHSALVVAVLLTPLPASAAKLLLNNGDQISGEIVALEEGVLTLKNDVFGQVEVPWQAVVKLEDAKPVRIRLQNGVEVDATLQVNELGAVTIDQGELGVSPPMSKDDIVALNPAYVGPATVYSGRANVGGVFTRGNSEDDVLNIDAEFIARALDSRYTLRAEVNESESGGIKTTARRNLSAQYDAFFSKQDYLFTNIRFERDEFSDLKLRTSLGAGYGRQLWETDISALSTEIGLSYVNEDFFLAPDQSFPSLNLASNFDRKFWKKRLVFFNNTNLAISLEDAQDTLLKNRTGVRMPLGNGINLSSQLNVDYDNSPPMGVKKTDTSLIFSVGYGF